MSKYNIYAQQLNAIAKENFENYAKAKAEHDAALHHYNYNRRPSGISDGVTIARAARAEADYAEKKDAYNRVCKAYTGSIEKVAALREELAKRIEADFMASPDALDANTLELLKSGILKAGEYENLVSRNADNPTMLRVIARYAKQKADELGKIGDANERNQLNRVVAAAKKADGSDILEMFDNLAGVYGRCVKNPALSGKWDDLVAEVVENF